MDLDFKSVRDDSEEFEVALTWHRLQVAHYQETVERSQNPFRLTDRQTLYRLILPTLVIAVATIYGALAELTYCYQKLSCF